MSDDENRLEAANQAHKRTRRLAAMQTIALAAALSGGGLTPSLGSTPYEKPEPKPLTEDDLRRIDKAEAKRKWRRGKRG